MYNITKSRQNMCNIYNYFAYPPIFLSGFTDPVLISLKIIVPVLPFAKNIILPACKISGTKADCLSL